MKHNDVLAIHSDRNRKRRDPNQGHDPGMKATVVVLPFFSFHLIF